jgi:hypothetical protein
MSALAQRSLGSDTCDTCVSLKVLIRTALYRHDSSATALLDTSGMPRFAHLVALTCSTEINVFTFDLPPPPAHALRERTCAYGQMLASTAAAERRTGEAADLDLVAHGIARVYAVRTGVAHIGGPQRR